MAAMRAVGNGHQLPPHAHVREEPSEYLIQLDVSDFTENELLIEALGPQLTVRGDRLETMEDHGEAFGTLRRTGIKCALTRPAKVMFSDNDPVWRVCRLTRITLLSSFDSCTRLSVAASGGWAPGA